MRILLVHEYYRSDSPSGEDAMFRNERDLLVAAGHDVSTYEVHNDSIGRSWTQRAGVALAAPWSLSSYYRIRRLLRQRRPELAHFHNTFPLISPSAYRACQSAGVAVIQTLHNYRLICPGGLLQRDSRPCEECVGTGLMPALRHRCYRSSLPATGAAVAMLQVNRALGTYARDVDRYLALTEFARRRIVLGGIPGERVHVRPNALADDPGAGTGDGDYALYVGRLSIEKGIRTLLEAWRHLDALPLRIAGDGPLRRAVEDAASHSRGRVTYLGRLDRRAVIEAMAAARLLVIPSEWYEGLPVTYLEALATGTPIVASQIGSLAELVADGINGLQFTPGAAPDLVRAVLRLSSDESLLRRIRLANRRLFVERHAPSAAIRSLEGHYGAVLAARAQHDAPAELV